MKAVLEFNLPEDEQAHRRATQGARYHCVLYDFDQYLRVQHKYQKQELAGQYREYLGKLMSEASLSLNDDL